MTPPNFRSLFEINTDIAYLNCAYMGPLPRASFDAGVNSYAAKQRPWEIDIQADFFDAPEALRSIAARFFGSQPETIALVPSASYGLASAAQNIDLADGQDILVLDEQFPSNVYTWQALARRTGARLVTVTRSANQSWTEALQASISSKTGLVAIPEVHWADGGRIDLLRISRSVKQVGASLVLDLTQSLGTSRPDLDIIDPDFAVAAAYKWLLGPYSMGFHYIAPRHHPGTPLEENWIARAGSENFARLVDYTDDYQPGARKFDMGERSAFQLVPSALASLQLIESWGLESLPDRLGALTTSLEDVARPLGLQCDTPERAAHYLCLALPENAPADLAARLTRHNVFVSQRGARLRVTPHLYNTPDDIDRFAAALKAELS